MKQAPFKLKSGNDMGDSATKLMKEAPLKEKLTSKKQLEDKVKGFFGNIKKGFKTASEKRRASAEKRSEQLQKFLANRNKKLEPKKSSPTTKKKEKLNLETIRKGFETAAKKNLSRAQMSMQKGLRRDVGTLKGAVSAAPHIYSGLAQAGMGYLTKGAGKITGKVQKKL